jgi:hypothetical protein
MTSAEIKRFTIPPAADKEHTRNLWLREIALQLALQNEREERGDTISVNPTLRKVGLGVEASYPDPPVNQYVIAIQQAFPFVHSDGVRGDRQWWGVWYGPGPAARSFPTREAAEKHLEENPPLLPPEASASGAPDSPVYKPIAPWMDRNLVSPPVKRRKKPKYPSKYGRS